MNILAPIVLRSSPVNWRVLSEIQPSFNPEVVPRIDRRFFSSHNTGLHPSEYLPSSEGTIPNLARVPPSSPTVVNSSIRDTSPEPIITHSYFTRSRARPQC